PTLSGTRGEPHEHGLEAERTDPQAHFVILGHAAARERLAVLHWCELRQRLSGDRAADSRERNGGADRLAHDELLDVRLGELVAIMAGDPPRMRIGKGKHRKLDHRGALDQPVEYPKLERVDD